MYTIRQGIPWLAIAFIFVVIPAISMLPYFLIEEKSPEEEAAEIAKYFACYDMCVESEIGPLRECVGNSFTGMQKPYHPDELKSVIRSLKSCIEIYDDSPDFCLSACYKKIEGENG